MDLGLSGRTALVMAASKGTAQMPKMASTSPKKCIISALNDTDSFATSRGDAPALLC